MYGNIRGNSISNVGGDIMIYILSGVAKAGKTLLSEEIRKRYDVSVFSTDYIMMMLHRGNKDLDIDVYASDSSVATKIEPYVYGMIETMVENNASYLIEGVHFNTEFSYRLKKKFKDEIRFLYIGYKDIQLEDKVEELYKYKEVMDNPWLFDHQGESVEEIVKYLKSESSRIYHECIDLKLDYIDVYDIKEQKEDIIRKLIE